MVHRHTFRQNIYTHKIKISSLVTLAELSGLDSWVAVTMVTHCRALLVVFRLGGVAGDWVKNGDMFFSFLQVCCMGFPTPSSQHCPPLACGLLRGWYEIHHHPAPQTLPPDTVKTSESPCGPLWLLPVQPSWTVLRVQPLLDGCATAWVMWSWAECAEAAFL